MEETFNHKKSEICNFFHPKEIPGGFEAELWLFEVSSLAVIQTYTLK